MNLSLKTDGSDSGGHGGDQNDHGGDSHRGGDGNHGSTLKLRTRIRPKAAFQEIEVDADGSLLDVLKAGAIAGGQTILPPNGTPLDRLYGLDNRDVVGPALDLGWGIKEYLHRPHTSKKFEIELVLAIRVNARWAIATNDTLSPRDILNLPGINLSPDDYSLYTPGSNQPLPPDVAIKLHRGDRFEAQRDGKYGAR
jgi:hypothetical protein